MPQHALICSLLLVLSFSTIGQARGTQRTLPQSLLELQHSPAPYECAVLSAHVYRDDLQQGDPVVWIDPHTQQVHALRGWVVYQSLTENQEDLLSQAFQQLGLPYGYRGVIYLNARKKQLVLAHRGTDLNNMSAIKTDARSIAQNVIGGQERSIPLLLEEALKIAHQEKCTLTVTGHSLGGWLAQITAFIAQDQYPEEHVKAITFDSPGVKPMLEQINARINPTPLDQLDITNYLSSPNLINACNPHIGTVYRVVFAKFNPKRRAYTLQSHAMTTLISAFNPTTGDAYQTLVVHSWPLVSKKSLNLAEKIIAGDKLNAILALCQLVKKCINQEALGEYSGFFKLAKQANYYHPQPYTKSGKDAFDLTYKYHYHTTPFTPSQLHIRHFPETAQAFLRKLYAGSRAHAQIAAQAQFLQALAWNQQTGWVRIPSEPDLRLVCDQLLSIVLAHPELAHTAAPHTLLHATSLLPPPAVAFFVGREQTIKAFRQCFQAPQAYILAPPITGPGGIGKTQLALRVVQQQVEEAQYDHVFWIPAESEQKLIEAYLQLAEGLRLYLDKQNVKQTVRKVRAYLKDKHCLYVFDDAPDIAAIQAFLPLAQGHVLITSRNSAKEAWDTKPVQMNPLSEQEALTLAQTFGFPSSPLQAALKPLLAQVPRYPLTLVQLFSTLDKQGLSPEEFLTAMQRYTVEKQDQTLLDLLSEHPHARVGYAKSTLYVFKTSLEQLGQAAQGQQALQLLSQLGYLDPKGIPVAWLLTWDTADTSLLKRKTRDALSLLEKYSLIQWDRAAQQVYIHAETQLMVRHLHPQPTLETLINRLIAYVGSKEEAHQHLATWAGLLPHGRRLFERLDTTRLPAAGYVLAKYLADACQVTCFFDEGVSWAKKCLTLAQQRYSDQAHPDVAHALNRVGVSLGEIGRHQEALEHKQEALAMHQRLYPNQDHPDVAYSWSDVGSSLSQLGRHQEALEHKQEALAMRQRLYPNQDHPDVAHALNSIGELLTHLGRHQEALEHKQEALAIRQRLYPNQDHPDVARSFNSVGISLEDLDCLQEALAYKQQGLGMRQRLYPTHPDVGHSLNNVGETFLKLGNPEEGIKYCQQALALRKRLYPGQDHPYIAQSFNSLGKGYAALGNYEAALASYQEAVCMALRVYQRAHPQITKNYLPALIETLPNVDNQALVQQAKAEIVPLCSQVLGQEHALTQELLAAGQQP